MKINVLQKCTVGSVPLCTWYKGRWLPETGTHRVHSGAPPLCACFKENDGGKFSLVENLTRAEISARLYLSAQEPLLCTHPSLWHGFLQELKFQPLYFLPFRLHVSDDSNISYPCLILRYKFSQFKRKTVYISKNMEDYSYLCSKIVCIDSHYNHNSNHTYCWRVCPPGNEKPA